MANRQQHIVNGIVTATTGEPVPHLDVELIEQAFRAERSVGATKTDADGRYQIAYEAEAGSCKCAYVVRVLDRGTAAAESSPAFDPPASLQVDLVVAANHLHGVTEYKRLRAELTACAAEVPLVQLTAADVRFLASSTGLPADKITHLVVSEKLEGHSRIDSAFFYALLRQRVLIGAPGSLLNLRVAIDLSTPVRPLYFDVVLLDSATVQKAVRVAVEQRIVPRIEHLREISETLAKNRSEAQAYYRKEHPQQVLQTAAANLTASKISEVVAALQKAKGGDLPGFLSALRAIEPAPLAQSDNPLGSALASDPQLIADLHALGNLDKAAQSSPAFDAAALKGTPAQARRMEKLFPTASFAAQMKGATGKAALPNQDVLAQVLASDPKFDLATGNVDQLVSRAGTPQVRDQLKAVQRVFKLAPTHGQTTALLNAGVHSAAQISAMGQAQFVSRATADGAFTPAEAQTVFQKATDVHVATGMLAAELSSTAATASVAAMSPPRVAEALTLVSNGNPNLKQLFHLTDLCECKDCNSITSPSAYLVDVLQFLKSRKVVDTTVPGAVAANSAKDELWKRRSDLGDIDLSCDNTNVPLPYIDVVCELLEQAVAPDPGFSFNGPVSAGPAPAALIAALQANGLPFTDAAFVQPQDSRGNFCVRDAKVVCKLEGAGTSWKVRQLRQTFLTAAELAAAPEYVNHDAYTTLKNSSYAFGLPFDLDQEEAKVYLQQFDVARDELMRALADGVSPTDEQIAAEALGLSDHEHSLIVNSDTTHQVIPAGAVPAGGAVDTYWNARLADLSIVDTFLARTGFEYSDLQGLLQLAFLNPNNALFIKRQDSTCNTQTQTIEKLDETALDHIHRFIRLQRRLGWSQVTLDHAVSAARLGAGNISESFLVKAADLLRLKARVKLSLDELIILFGSIPIDGDPSRYSQIFLNHAANGAADPSLEVAFVATNPAKQLSDVAGSLAVAFGLKQSDMALLINLSSNPPLTFDNLSRVYSWASLSRAVRLAIGEFIVLLNLTAIDPLASPADTLRFLDASDRLRAARLKPSALQALLSPPAAPLPTGIVEAALAALQAALVAASDQNRSPFDANLTPDENEAAISAVVGRLPKVTPTDISTLLRIIENRYSGTPNAQAFLQQLFSPFFDPAAITGAQSAIPPTALAVPPSTVPAESQGLIQAVLAGVSRYLYEQARDGLVMSILASALHVDPDTAAVLLSETQVTSGGSSRSLAQLIGDDFLTNPTGTPPALPPVSETSLPAQFGAVRQFQRMAQLAAALAVSNDELQWLLDNARQLGWLQIDKVPYAPGTPAIPFGDWAMLEDALGLFKRFPPVANPDDADQPFTLRAVFAKALTVGEPIADLLDALAAVTGWDRAILGALDARLHFSTPDLKRYLQTSTYLRLEAAVTFLRRLGLDLPAGVQICKPQLGATDAMALRQALKARYSESEWLGVLKQVYDPLRQRKRDALVAYLLAVNPTFQRSDDLFDYFLVDVEMCSCQPTSRIVSAHGTLQLFVQRCLMAVEPKAVADTAVDDGWKQWSWMAAYRVWQANREVFLYPENWIDPPLRDDKSELFLDVEQKLQQEKLTDESVTNATIDYLEALDDIAFLEVMASTYELRNRTLHVFARTKGGDPPTYYYRRFVKETSWTPWQRVDLEVRGNHLVAFTRNGRLHLAWPVFIAKTNPDQDLKIPQTNQDGTQSVDKPEQRWDIQLATSELTNEGKWAPSRTSQDPLPWSLGWQSSLPDQSLFRFLPMDLHSEGFSIACFVSPEGGPDNTLPNYRFIGAFTLAGCKGYPEPISGHPEPYGILPIYYDAPTQFERFIDGRPGVDAAVKGLAVLPLTLQWIPLLASTPDGYRFTRSQQIAQLDFLLIALIALLRGQHDVPASPHLFQVGTFIPSFMEDGRHNYALVPAFYLMSTDSEGPSQPLSRLTYTDIQGVLEGFIPFLKQVVTALQDPTSNPATLAVQFLNGVFQSFAQLFQKASVWFKVEFYNFYHPLVCPLRKIIYNDGIPKLMARETQLMKTDFDFKAHYQPVTAIVPPTPSDSNTPSYPIEDIDFSEAGGYSSYNWELFFHLPFAIAVRLSGDGQYEKAMQWFHYIFNPTDTSTNPVPKKYWQTRPFFETENYDDELIDAIMNQVALKPGGATGRRLTQAIQDWRQNPFEPFLVARSRTVAFQQAVLMKYLDNLIAWGDSLFMQNTMESVNQATQAYVLADKLLGQRPRTIPPIVSPPPETYDQIEAKLDQFSNALLQLENLIPDISQLPHGGAEIPPSPLTSLYFCIPPNEKLLGYWDTVADRLFKIRHCQDINGVERTLALFSPPIDPGVLISALAQGLSLSDVLQSLSAPLPFYRFSTMVQRAVDLTQQVVSLGSEMLQVLEKRDAEALQRLRSTQEMALLDAQLLVKQQQVADATEQLQVLQRSIDVTTFKQTSYEARKTSPIGAIEDLGQTIGSGALDDQESVISLDQATAVMHLIPSFSVGLNGVGGTPNATISFGGENIAGIMAGFAGVSRERATIKQGRAGLINTGASYGRRSEDWDFQISTAKLELAQLSEQVTQANIKLTIAQNDLSAHQVSIDNSVQTDQFLRAKFSNQELYDYMVGKLSSVFFKSYQLALDFAHKAERCLQNELGTEQTFIRFDYWDNLKKGLLSGPRLLADIKQMEAAYLDQNRREYELTKHVSLAQLDPLALLQLKNGDKGCFFSLPEAVFDVDHPGHYFRRLKTVSLTIPCVAGPYTSVSCKLSIVGSRYRQNASPGTSGYPEDPNNDIRFRYNVGSIQSIATSQAQNDGGLFEVNFHDERYLPFEAQGAISSWRLELPSKFPQFDYQTITDVILHVRYTARDGGSNFRSTVEDGLSAQLQSMLADARHEGVTVSFDIRRQFPNEWYRLQQSGSTPLTIESGLLPLFIQGHSPQLQGATWLARVAGSPQLYSLSLDETPFSLSKDTSFGGIAIGDSTSPSLDTPFTLKATNANQLEELSLLLAVAIS